MSGTSILRIFAPSSPNLRIVSDSPSAPGHHAAVTDKSAIDSQYPVELTLCCVAGGDFARTQAVRESGDRQILRIDTHGFLRDLPGQNFRNEARNGFADLGRGFFHQKVRSFDSYRFLIGPRAAEVPLSADQKSGRISVNEQLGYGAAGKPASLTIHNLSHVLRLSFDCQFPGPCQDRLPRRSWISVVPAIDVHGLAGDVAQRQQVLDESP
jgi:hypothetical protein